MEVRFSDYTDMHGNSNDLCLVSYLLLEIKTFFHIPCTDVLQHDAWSRSGGLLLFRGLQGVRSLVDGYCKKRKKGLGFLGDYLKHFRQGDPAQVNGSLLKDHLGLPNVLPFHTSGMDALHLQSSNTKKPDVLVLFRSTKLMDVVDLLSSGTHHAFGKILLDQVMTCQEV